MYLTGITNLLVGDYLIRKKMSEFKLTQARIAEIFAGCLDEPPTAGLVILRITGDGSALAAVNLSTDEVEQAILALAHDIVFNRRLREECSVPAVVH
jgi:hypothetical protein